jgi:hypothetical protein
MTLTIAAFICASIFIDESGQKVKAIIPKPISNLYIQIQKNKKHIPQSKKTLPPAPPWLWQQ